MSQCTDVDAAVRRLESKIDAQNRQIADLKRRQEQCCSNKNNNQNNNQKDKVDLTPIYQRLNKLEQYCESIESLFTQLSNTIKPIIAIFK